MKRSAPANSPTPITEIVLPGLVELDGLHINRRILPAPAPGQALVQVEASGISFAEQSMRRGRYPGQPAFPFVPGYDLVGTIRAVGPGVSPGLVGTRCAAVTKIGGWSSHVLISAADLVPVPTALDPALVETVMVNGVTAWQMLYRKARAKPGQTILVHGANGGVGTVLCQLAMHAGIRVIGTAAPKHHAALRALGVEPIDYNTPDLAARVRHYAPAGVNAIFDHLGLDSARQSLQLLARGGSLICYGNATALTENTSMLRLFVVFLSRILWWNLLPNSYTATFYNFWGGSLINPTSFRRRLRADLTALFDLLVKGAIHPPIAGRFALTDIQAAMALAESHTVHGKVILVP